MPGPYPPPDVRDYPIPDSKYTGSLQGGEIMHSSTHWQDQDGHHRESYNYDREGNIENLHSDKGPGPYDPLTFNQSVEHLTDLYHHKTPIWLE